MTIIDLSMPLTHKMPVFEGDPEVNITEIHTIENEGWNLRQLTLSTHLATHLNVPYHMVENGKRLDAYPLESFMGKAVLYTEGLVLNKETGVIFRDINIDKRLADLLIASPPKFIGLSQRFDLDIPIEKLLLEHDILSYENLVNTDKLPDSFMFYGVPLNIPMADGSPVRAFATFA